MKQEHDCFSGVPLYLYGMRRVDQIISEIKELRNELNHRAAFRVLQLLENNKKLFLENIEKDTFSFLLSGFSELSEASSTSFDSAAFKRDYYKTFDSLLFHLNRI